jgi:hypothetical protein
MSRAVSFGRAERSVEACVARRLLLLVLLIGCGREGTVDDKPDDGIDPDAFTVDDDGDGVTERDGDCDDTDPAIGPDAPELCNGIDDDCDDVVDEEAVDAPAWYPDNDDDGFGSATSLSYACERPPGFVDNDLDCVDSDARVNPHAQEVCNGGDDDCDALVDDDDDNELDKWLDLGEEVPDPLIGGVQALYVDGDGDGWGAGVVVYACESGNGFAGRDGDCNDADAAFFPGAPEAAVSGLDNDCDGFVSCFVDADDDGFGGTTTTAHPLTDPLCEDPSLALGDPIADDDDDCDDAEPAVNPGADEVCNTIDDDCDSLVDDADDDYTGEQTWYTDGDGDGFGTQPTTLACEAPLGFVANDEDCDDTDEDVSPSGIEVCNEVDDDCDGDVDEDVVGGDPWWPDGDGDGAGAGVVVFACDPPTDHVDNDDDCDDTEPTVYDGAPAIQCDGFDNDCDPATLEAGGVRLDGVVVANLTAAIGSSVDGSHITLCEGEHTGVDLVLRDQVLVDSLGGSGETVVDAQGLGAIFDLPATRTATLRGMELTGGTGALAGEQGGAVWVGDGASLTLDDLIVRDNHAGLGAGVYVSSGATLAMTDVEIRGNVADDPSVILTVAGGLYAEEDAVVTGTDVLLRNNDADICGGMSIEPRVSVTGTRFTVERNDAVTLQAGGVCMESGSSLTGVDVIDNHSDNSGGGIWGTDVTLTNVQVLSNTCGLSGAGLFLNGDNTLTDVVISGNTAGIDAGGLNLVTGGTATLTDSVVTSNVAEFFAAEGGGALVDGVLTSVRTDWGSAATSNRNLPRDVSLQQSNTSFNFSGVSDFVCDDSAGTCQ